MLTEKQIKDYIIVGGNFCPNCNDNNIEGTGALEVDSNYATQSVFCHVCNSSWTDIYQLTDIENFTKGEAK